MVKLGIGIATYRRIHRLEKTLDSVSAFTTMPYRLMVADDGSEDGTVEVLCRRRVPHISGPNRGIAWNKNRLLYHLVRIAGCDVVILLEDDTFPLSRGWEQPWVEATLRHGHINFASIGLDPHYKGGSGTPEDPYRSPITSANCVGYARRAIRAVGYMDTRFGQYGYEHCEHTRRLVRAGFGGDPESGATYMLRSDLMVEDIGTSRYVGGLHANAIVFEQLINETSLFRRAWRGKAQRLAFQADLRTIRTYSAAAWMQNRLLTTTTIMRWPDKQRVD